MQSNLMTAIVVLLTIHFGFPAFAQTSFGSFEGKLITEALPDGRNLRVVSPLSYTDPQGFVWKVPAGMRTDGASVPRFFWSLFPPFSGRHRIAAVVHDRYCRSRNRPWRDVHLMFYYAMRAAEVGDTIASIMYAAVYTFGPRWSLTGPSRAPKRPTLSEQDQKEAFESLRDWIKETKPSPAEIARYVNRTRVRQLGTKAAR